jgi:hypothetical protein
VAVAKTRWYAVPRARIVTMKGHLRTITYVCEECLHEWDVTDDSPPTARSRTLPVKIVEISMGL